VNTTELRDLLRSEIDDAVAPYLVSDALVYAYINDAQKMFCRLTEGIEDATTYTLAIASPTEWYALNPAILKLRRAVNTATGRSVDLVNAEKAEARGIAFDGRTGPLSTLVLGLEKGKARAWPKPNAAATVALEVFRLPVNTTIGGSFEIDEQHHLHLLLWVKHLAYGVQDSEVYDKRLSAELELGFRNYCAEARKEQERARRVVGTVIYGGI